MTEPLVWTFENPENPPEPSTPTLVRTTKRSYTLEQLVAPDTDAGQWRPQQSPGNHKPWNEWLSAGWGPLTEILPA